MVGGLDAEHGAVTSTLTGILGSLSSIDASFHQPASALVASAQGTDPNKWSGGPWVRVSGGKNDISSTGTSILCPARRRRRASQGRTQYQGIQAGFDSGTLNLGGSMWNVHLGIMGGEIMASFGETLGPGKLAFNSRPVRGHLCGRDARRLLRRRDGAARLLRYRRHQQTRRPRAAPSCAEPAPT